MVVPLLGALKGGSYQSNKTINGIAYNKSSFPLGSGESLSRFCTSHDGRRALSVSLCGLPVFQLASGIDLAFPSRPSPGLLGSLSPPASPLEDPPPPSSPPPFQHAPSRRPHSARCPGRQHHVPLGGGKPAHGERLPGEHQQQLEPFVKVPSRPVSRPPSLLPVNPSP